MFLLSLLLLFSAVFLLLISKAEINICYNNELKIVISIGISEVILTDFDNKNKRDKKTRNGELTDTLSTINKILKGSNITVKRLFIPNYFISPIANSVKYILISLFLAYLDSYSSRINSDTDAFCEKEEDQKLIIDIDISSRLYIFLSSFISHLIKGHKRRGFKNARKQNERYDKSIA